MTNKKYFIEDVKTGEVLNNDGSWEPFIDGSDHESFTDQEDVINHIDNLPDGIYRIFVRYYKN